MITKTAHAHMLTLNILFVNNTFAMFVATQNEHLLYIKNWNSRQ